MHLDSGEKQFVVPGIKYEVSGIRYQVSGIGWNQSLSVTMEVEDVREQICIGLNEDRLRSIEIFGELTENGVAVSGEGGLAQNFKHLPSNIEQRVQVRASSKGNKENCTCLAANILA